MSDVDLMALRVAFAPELVGKLPRVTCPDCSDRRKTCAEHRKSKCGVCGSYVSERHIHIDYVGHADVTSRLLEVDPEWNWEPKAEDEHGLPIFDTDDSGSPVGLWIRLTVGGVSRLGYGSVPSGQPDAVKVLIGDALRNAAMRFGVALDLWAKGDRADPTAENATASAGRAARGSKQPAGDAFENAAPAAPRQQQRQQGQVSRPAQRQQGQDSRTGQQEAGDEDTSLRAIDEAAQEYANQAHEARVLSDLEDIHRKAREAGKITATIRNPGGGGTGKLAVYIDWKRRQLKEAESALNELQEAGRAAGLDAFQLDAHVASVTGTDLESATPAQLRQAVQALTAKAAA